MSEKIEPAMTPEEWNVADDIEQLMTFEIASDILPKGIVSRHGAAALALYGQPFGFSADDVRLLERCEASIGWKHEAEVRSLIHRIEA